MVCPVTLGTKLAGMVRLGITALLDGWHVDNLGILYTLFDLALATYIPGCRRHFGRRTPDIVRLGLHAPLDTAPGHVLHGVASHPL